LIVHRALTKKSTATTNFSVTPVSCRFIHCAMPRGTPRRIDCAFSHSINRLQLAEKYTSTTNHPKEAKAITMEKVRIATSNHLIAQGCFPAKP